MDIRHALTKLAEQVSLAGDGKLPILLNGAANEIEQLQQRNAELAAQVIKLRKVIEFFADDESLDIEVVRVANDVLHETSSQCLVKHDSKVAKAAFVAGIECTGQGYNGEHGLSDKQIEELADLYLERKIKL